MAKVNNLVEGIHICFSASKNADKPYSVESVANKIKNKESIDSLYIPQRTIKSQLDRFLWELDTVLNEYGIYVDSKYVYKISYGPIVVSENITTEEYITLCKDSDVEQSISELDYVISIARFCD